MHNIERMPLYALKKDSLPYVQGGGRMDGRMNKGTDRRMDEQSSRCSTGLHPLRGRYPAPPQHKLHTAQAGHEYR